MGKVGSRLDSRIQWRAFAVELALMTLGGCHFSTVTEVASGSDIDPWIRPALAADGTVVAAEADRLLLSNGLKRSTIELGPLGLQMNSEATPHRSLQIRRPFDGADGDLVFVANRPQRDDCTGGGRGAYRLPPVGGALTTLFEGCGAGSGAIVGRDVGMSPNGTIAFSQITNGQGALYRGPATGPVDVLHTGSGSLYNAMGLDINDAGRAVVQMEYSEGAMLERAILAFDTPEQPLESFFTALEKLKCAQQPIPAINAEGTVAFSLSAPITFATGGVDYALDPGVYTVVPALLNTPRAFTQVADTTGDYCAVGKVDINDAGVVVFEATLRSAAGGPCREGFDGIFRGPHADRDAVIDRLDPVLGAHQGADDFVLGEINDGGQVSFATISSAPAVDRVKVWRSDP